MTTENKRLLVLTPRIPYPVIGGDRLRIYEICKALSKSFSLTLLTFCETRAEMDMALPKDGVFDRVERVFLSRIRSYLNTALAIPGSTPLQVAYYKSAAFEKAMLELLPVHDGVLAHLIRCGDYIKESEKPSILEMTDAISLNYERIKKFDTPRGLKALAYKLDASRLRKYERQIIKEVDLTVLVSEVDRRHLVEDKIDNLLVCSNGVDLDRLSINDRQQSNEVILFIGNMNSLQNMDAALYFAKDILPQINKQVQATFRVVGRIDDRNASKLRAFENVEVTGEVEDLNSITEDARCGVCPIRVAAGVQNKVLEYMALGLPVVSSSIGLEGFTARPSRDLLVADTPDEYVEAIVKLWGDKALSRNLQANAYAYINAYHQWSECLAPLVERTKALLGEEI